ncbi:hypothetical protein E2C01_040101 [Portunus trituberculatus]|uniref:Uncharacterized protein n=1 Tax=Portunus trituberculatus TaxID=210409 RepID=A0A5B7FFJ4_PORTR|nr:hypothetical protein [Portunus trituberculatus]
MIGGVVWYGVAGTRGRCEEGNDSWLRGLQPARCPGCHPAHWGHQGPHAVTLLRLTFSISKVSG